jgi:hypothetical protein
MDNVSTRWRCLSTMANAASAITTRIGAHLGRRELMLGFMESLYKVA